MAFSRAIGKEIVDLIMNSHSDGLTGNLIKEKDAMVIYLHQVYYMSTIVS